MRGNQKEDEFYFHCIYWGKFCKEDTRSIWQLIDLSYQTTRAAGIPDRNDFNLPEGGSGQYLGEWEDHQVQRRNDGGIMRGTVAKRLRKATMKDVAPKFRLFAWINENRKMRTGTLINKPDSPRGRYLQAKKDYKNGKHRF